MLYVVTPCSRPENLELIYNSIISSIPVEKFRNFECRWVIILDKSTINYNIPSELYTKITEETKAWISFGIEKALAGHAHRNVFLNIFLKLDYKENDWAYFLDDDTLLHPNFYNYVFPQLLHERTAVVFHQLNKDGSPRLFANRNNLKVCHVDMGQYVVNLNKLPETHRFIETDYCADGHFIEQLYEMTADKTSFYIINEFCSTYNALQP